MKVYKIEVTTAEKPYKHIEIVKAEDDLEAIDKVVEYYTVNLNKEIMDIKVV